MNWKGTLSSLVLLIIILTGCGNGAYKEAVEKGENAARRAEFTEALQYFKVAIEEEPENKRIKNAIIQTELLIEGWNHNKESELTAAISKFEEVLAFEDSLDGITKTATDLLEILKEEEQSFGEIQRLRDVGNNQGALDYIDGLFEEDGTGAIYEEELNLLKEEIRADLLFAQIKGYAKKDGEGTQLCQITDEDILCAYLTVDVTGYKDITSIHVEGDNSLRVEVEEENDLLFTNIVEDSFNLDGEHYDVVSKEYVEKTIANKLVSQTIENVFDKELFKELKVVLPHIDYFTNSIDARNEDNGNTGSGLQAYSEEEIEYARVWLEYRQQYGTGPYPTLNVSYWEKGRPISMTYEEDSAVFREDVIVLSGEFTADGSIVYSSNGDGTINIYDIPSHWPPDYELEGGVKAYTTKIALTPEKKTIPKGIEEEVLSILKTMEIDR